MIACDLEQPDAGDQIAAVLTAEGAEIEYVVNNAGFGLFGHAIELDRAAQLGMIAVNVRAMTDLSLRFSEQLIRHRGGILNVASIASFLPGPGMAVYYASKAYVLSFTEAMRRELAPRGVRVTALCPGPVNTPLLQELFAKDAERAARRLVHVPMGRFGEPEEMAAAVLFLASDDSSFMTANTFLVDGGISGAYVTPL